MVKAIYKKLVSERRRIAIRRGIKRIYALAYRGTTVRCNCCNRTFRKFLAKGNQPRANAECPYCGSLERSRRMKFYLEREVFSQAMPQRILHFAPEKCLDQLFKNQSFEYVDADINPAYASHPIDITRIPFPPNYFDLIICSHVLGHVANERRAISELHRVLKPGGQALILSLLQAGREKTLEMPELETAAEKLHFYGEPDLCRAHGKDFIDRLGQANWTVECVDYAQSLPAAFQDQYRLGNGERELFFVCVK
ncbi:class I SAM-dependent methyltransferase [Mangrovibacterium marinum]|uniref:Methyltransferase family protein n=1 Tax=Mangrovibacterium marinum TaxID=1639118 RepID=A0A2T5C152_9BACT|nr:class I SAM-dependent methyltransferase [Mangrovibacterium marinum]PTN08341.1 methyltransferase family protein [Mangrovibacterium marinum]